MKSAIKTGQFRLLSAFVVVALLSSLIGYWVAYSQFSSHAQQAFGSATQTQHGKREEFLADARNQRDFEKSIDTSAQPDPAINDNTTYQNILERPDFLNNEFNQKVEDIASALLSIASLSESGDFEEVAQVKQQLLMMAQSDDRLLGELIQSFKNIELDDDNPQVKQALMQVLASIKDPQVESLAQDLAISSNRSKQLAGLELLSQLNISNEQSLDIAVSALSQNSDDPELLQYAMQAIPKMTISAEKNTEVLNQLSDLSKHENESVRSASLFLIAQQAKTSEQLSPLFDALNSKTVDEKISAIMAIEQSSVVSQELKDILLARITDKNELAEVRAMAANSLNRFNLNAGELDSVNQFKKQQRWDPQH